MLKYISKLLIILTLLLAVSLFLCCDKDIGQKVEAENQSQQSFPVTKSPQKEYAGSDVMQKYFDRMDHYIRKKQFRRAESLLDEIRNTKDYEECMPQSVCHAVRFYEDDIKNKSGEVSHFPKITGVYSHAGDGGAYTNFCVKHGKLKEICFTAYSGCEFRGDPQDGQTVTVYYDPIEEDRAVKVVAHGNK